MNRRGKKRNEIVHTIRLITNDDISNVHITITIIRHKVGSSITVKNALKKIIIIKKYVGTSLIISNISLIKSNILQRCREIFRSFLSREIDFEVKFIITRFATVFCLPDKNLLI